MLVDDNKDEEDVVVALVLEEEDDAPPGAMVELKEDEERVTIAVNENCRSTKHSQPRSRWCRLRNWWRRSNRLWHILRGLRMC